MIEGQCHCGNIKWTYPLKLESVTACNCSLCSRYGALWAYGYLQDGIKISGSTKAYERDRKLNGFHFCTNCGCMMYYLSNTLDEQGRRRLAVNTRMAVNSEQIQDLPIDHFDGKGEFVDLPGDGRVVRDLWF